MTTTTTTRSEAYDYGFTGQPFCPPPPSGLAAYEEAAWVADFHAGAEARRAEDAGYRDGYCNIADERRIHPPGVNPDYDRGIEAGRAGKDGHPNYRFSRR